MGVTKTDNYTRELTDLASISKVLGHPARVAILDHISKATGCICGDLVDEIGLAQATISQHLRELKSVGIIKGNIEGTSVCYCLDYTVWNNYHQKLNDFSELLNSRNNSCC
jgi:DNA-binding transcriptional ArsR family regulator